jgi:hypothetical protein
MAEVVDPGMEWWFEVGGTVNGGGRMLQQWRLL